jgi:transglutaminase-like putative cysteine protease
MTDRPLIGLLLALIIESAHWLKFRWDFAAEATGRAWQFNTIAIGLAAILIFLEETAYMALPNLLTWLPPLLLPMQFVQSFGLNQSLPLSTFSFLARYRHKRNLRLGLTEEPMRINFGNVFFIATLIASALGSQANSAPYSLIFLPGLIILTGWRLLSAGRSRPLALILALSVAGGIALAGQLSLDILSEWIGNRSPSRSPFNPNSFSTSIGRPGPVELSPDIVWRLRPLEKSRTPTLLRTASYNTFHGSTWQNQRIAASDFKDLDNIEPTLGEIFFLVGADLPPEAQKEAISNRLPRFKLRGTAFAETPLPLPGDATSLRDFELDGIERNSFGTVRIFPKRSVIEGTVLWQGDANAEFPPIPKEDLATPTIEFEVLQAALREIRLDEQPTLQGKLKTLRSWFQQNFKYSKYLTISNSNFSADSRSAIDQFLTTNRSGHCEYFATVTALLLREAGIPTRYAIGYAVTERDSKRQEYVIRGTHAHAWCRVWDSDAARWIDFDTTPGSWLIGLSPQNTTTQRINDALKRIREDFSLWRNRPANRLAASLIMFTIAFGIIGFIVKKLWKSKRRLEAAVKATGYEGLVTPTPLNALEPKAEKKLGIRPPGQPLAAWLMLLRPSLPDSNALEEAIQLHQSLRFDPAPTLPTQRERLAELTRQLEIAIKRV